MSELLRAAARGVSRRAVALPLGAAVLLAVAATPALDEPAYSGIVLQGAALLLALAAAAAVDEPGARLLDASPTTFARRVLLRLACLLGVVLPAAVAIVWWATRWHPSDSQRAVLELVAVAAVAVALSASLRRWASVAEPALLTGPILLLGLLLARWFEPHLPDVALTASERLALVTALAAAAAVTALRDPATAGRAVPRRR